MKVQLDDDYEIKESDKVEIIVILLGTASLAVLFIAMLLVIGGVWWTGG